MTKTPDLGRGLARFLSPTGEVVGAGFLVSERHIVTCAHVVSAALGPEAEETVMAPTEPVALDWPLVASNQEATAKIVKWYPARNDVRTGDLDDIAVLVLTDEYPLPREVEPLPIVVLEETAYFDRSVRMCGFAKDAGDWVEGKLQGRIGTGWVQVDQGPGQLKVAAGFSGAAVWDKQEDVVVGMIATINDRDDVRSGFMIPADSLVCAWPELEIYSRPPNPYRGLEAFREQDAHNFMGREQDVQAVLAALARPFLAVVGASGSGKSSLLFAGVIPPLRQRGNWLIASFRPRGEPFRELAAALIELLYPTVDALERAEKQSALATKLAGRQLHLADLISEILKANPDTRLLLIADQFEELYTQNLSLERQRQFLDELVAAVGAHIRKPAFNLVLAARLDFLGQLLDYEPLAEWVKPHHWLLGPLGRAGLETAIERPAQQAKVQMEDGLIERILHDLGEQPGTLPLLQFALTQLWERQRHRWLTHQAYEAIGGVTEALARHADEVLGRFPNDQERLRRIFVQLVHPGEGGEDTRQVATREQVGADNWNLVQELADNRLVVTGRDPQGQDTVEVVHETLIRHWWPLREWLREDRSFRLWQNGLRQALAEWEHTGRDAGALLAGARLAEAEERLTEYGVRLSKGETDYIQASINRRVAETAERERQRQDRERLHQRINFGLATFLVVVLGLAGVARQQALNAEQRAALLSANTANSLTSEGALNQALLLMLDSSHVFDDNSVPDTLRIALSKALEKKQQTETRFLFPNMQVFDTGDALLLVNPQTNDIWRLSDSLDPKLLVHGIPDDDRIRKIARTSQGNEYLILRYNDDIEEISVNGGEKRKLVSLSPPQGWVTLNEDEPNFLAGDLIVRQLSPMINTNGAEAKINSNQKNHYQIFDTIERRIHFIDTPINLRIVGRAPGNAFYGQNHDDQSFYEIHIEKAGVTLKPVKLNEMDAIGLSLGIRKCVSNMPKVVRMVALRKLSYSGLYEAACENFNDNTLIVEKWSSSAGPQHKETLFQANGNMLDVRQLFSHILGHLSPQVISWVGYSQVQDNELKTERIAILLNRSAYVLTRELRDQPSSDRSEENWSLLLNYRHTMGIDYARFIGNRLVTVEPSAGRLVAHYLNKRYEPLFSNSKAEFIGSEKPIETLHQGNCIGYSIPIKSRIRLASDLEIIFDAPNGDDITEEASESASTNAIIKKLKILSNNKEFTVSLGDAVSCVQFSADQKRLATISDKDVKIYDFEHILKTEKISGSEIGFIDVPNVISAIFSDPTGEGIVTANLTNQVLLWKRPEKGKNWISSEIYRGYNPIRYAEPDLTGQRLLLIEDEGEGQQRGLLYSLNAQEPWLKLGTEYKWLGVTFTDKLEIAVSKHSEWARVISIPPLSTMVTQAMDALSPECRPPSPEKYRESPCWPSF